MIDGHKLRLRALEPRDLEPILEFRKNRDVTRHLVNFRLPLSEAEERGWIARMRKSARDHVFSIETKRGHYVGSVGFHDIEPMDRFSEFGLLIANPRHWGRGYAAEAVRLGLVTAFERLNLNRLEAPVLRSNDVACNMYAQLGFKEEGRLRERRFVDGRYVDVVLFGFLARDFKPKQVWRALGASDAKIRRRPAALR